MVKLNEKAEVQLKRLGFHEKRFNSTMSELDRIKADDELVGQINKFSSQGRGFFETKDGKASAYHDPNDRNIYFGLGSQYVTARILAHEVGHALGRNQAKSADYYPTAKSYAQARGYGEAEAIYNEARMVAYEEQRNGRAYSTHISGGLYPQVKGKSYEQVKDLLARENMYGMYPSTNGSVRLSYYENDILFFMHRRTAFEKDFAEAGLRQSDMVGFVKHMANYDTFGDSRGNNVNANGAFDRQSLLQGKPTTRLNGGASMYGDAGNDVMTGTKSNDRMLGGSGNDTLKGGDGNDLLAGNAGKDRLYGGRGYDTYRADRYDTIRDEDGKGEVFLDGRRLRGGVRDLSEHDRTVFRDGNTVYDWNRKTGVLDVNGLKIENFKNGDLGIRLEEGRGAAHRTGTYNQTTSEHYGYHTNAAESNPDKIQKLRALIDGFKNDTDGSFAARTLEENRAVVENFRARQQERLAQNGQQQPDMTQEMQPEIQHQRNFGGRSFG